MQQNKQQKKQHNEQQNMLSQLKRHGYKQTEKRQAILTILQRNKRFMTVKEINEELKQAYPSVSVDTAYRNLSAFVDIGLLEITDLQGERRYRLRCDESLHHHHHFICTGCGKTTVIADACPLERIEKPNDFIITGHRFEIYGNCQDCI